MDMILNNGVHMPMMGFGTFRVTDLKVCRDSVYSAIRAGYRLIDTAQCYRNEEAVGEAIADAIADGLVRREELFVTTKSWFQSFEPDECRARLEESFRKLRLDTIDMVLLHWPYGNIYGAWRVLEEYYEAGKIRAIGVSNMEADRLIDLIHFNRVKPAVNQIETHLYCQRREERAWLDKLGVAHQAYSPLGQGFIREMFEEPAVQAAAENHGKTAAQIMLRFLLQSDIAIIPKSTHEERIRENFDITDFELTAEEMDALRALDRAMPMMGVAERPEKAEEAMQWRK